MKYYVESLNKYFNSEKDAFEAEEAHEKKLAEEKAKKEELANTRKARAEEVEKAYKEVAEAKKKADELLAAFCKDYGAYYKTYKEGEKIPSLFDWLFDWF